ncbi:MAG: HAD hydrolase-like protein [Acidobacteriota bacterium]
MRKCFPGRPRPSAHSNPPDHPNAGLEAYRKECLCRKPATGMADEAAQRFGIDPGASYVVGDTYRDMRLGFNIGARTILLMTGYGRGEFEHHRNAWSRMPDLIAGNLLEAAEMVLQELNARTHTHTLSESSLS